MGSVIVAAISKKIGLATTGVTFGVTRGKQVSSSASYSARSASDAQHTDVPAKHTDIENIHDGFRGNHLFAGQPHDG